MERAYIFELGVHDFLHLEGKVHVYQAIFAHRQSMRYLDVAYSESLLSFARTVEGEHGTEGHGPLAAFYLSTFKRGRY